MQPGTVTDGLVVELHAARADHSQPGRNPTLVNYATNPSFELDTNSDGTADDVTAFKNCANAPTLSRVAGRVSGYAQRIQLTGAAGDSSAYCDIGPFTPTANRSVVPGDYITVGVWAKGSLSGIDANINIRWRNAADGSISISSQAIALTGSWQRFVITAQAPALADHVYFREIALTGIDNGDTADIYLDDVTCTKTNYDPGFFSGSSGVGYVWEGTANASRSFYLGDPLWHDLSGNGYDGTLTNVRYAQLRNYIKNPRQKDTDANGAPDGWVTEQTPQQTLTYLANQGAVSGNAARMVAAYSTIHYTDISETSDAVFAAGDSVTVSGYIDVESVTGSIVVGLRIVYLNAAGGYVGEATSTGRSAVTGGWVRETKTVTLPANTAKVKCGFMLSQMAAGEGGTFRFSNLMLTRSAYAPAYFDGASGTGYSWAGTADASVSVCSFKAESGWAGNGSATDPWAVTFDGVSDQTSVIGPTSVTDFTIEAFAYLGAEPTANKGICGYYGRVRMLCQGAGSHYFGVWIDGTEKTAGKSVATNIGWHHYVFRRSGSSIVATVDCVNGAAVGGLATSAVNIAAVVGSQNGTYYWNGNIAVFRVYSRALSDAEVAQNYAAGPGWPAYLPAMKTRVLAQGVM